VIKTVEIELPKTGEAAHAVYEHTWAVRFSHWLNSVSLLVMVASGFQIFRAFPSFGAKIPQKDLLNWPKAFALGGWLGGGLQWHITFMWIYIATGLFYLAYQMFTLNYRQVPFLSCLSDVHLELSPGAVPAPRFARSLAHGALLLLLWTQAGCPRGLQSAAKTGVYVRAGSGGLVRVDRVCGVEAGAVFLAGLDDGRLPLGPDMAFCRDVGDFILPSGTPRHGSSSRLE
jgi:hypothetical protein